MSDVVTIEAPTSRARIRYQGAELCALSGPAGDEMIWQAGPDWPRHAPILFPIVGKLAGDLLRHEGRAYPLTQHGFARDRRFSLIEQTGDTARFELVDDTETHARFPFAFRLEVGYRIAAGLLFVSYRIENPGTAPLGAAIGAHPAFPWPLAPGIAKSAHRLEFSTIETATIRRLRGGLLDPTPIPSPIDGSVLALDEALFSADAIILPRVESRWVRYTAPGAEPLAVAWNGFRSLGLWSKPGASFLCIEPWFGTASPLDFDGDFLAKPDILILPPGGAARFSHTIGLGMEGCRTLTQMSG
jgi:galactose mutarotase-like enzyme